MSAGADLDLARSALYAIPPDLPRDAWVRAAMAAHATGLGFDDFDTWSSGAESYRAEAARDTWRSIRPGPVGAGTLYAMAGVFGWTQRGWRDGPAARPPRNQRAAIQLVECKSLSAAELARWDTYGAVSGAGLAYLQARQCVVPPADGDLRYHPAIRHWPTAYVGPALVALVTDATTCEPLTLHFTWVRSDGSKADVERPRLLLGGHRKAGGVIRLWPDEAVTYGLAVAEGVESALSIAHAHAPAWSCIDAGNLSSFPVLDGIESLLIAADHDTSGVGIRASSACAERWAAAGREVYVVAAPTQGHDINDLAREAA
jgi:putative DNA primase/helicase